MLRLWDATTIYPPPTFDTTRPHPARVRNYLLGGKDSFSVDQESGGGLIMALPEIVDVVRASRQFLVRAVGHLAGEMGVRQFLDIGPGLPMEDNTHRVAQRLAPETRVVYVDNDPLVLTHARALFVSTPEGATACVDADLHDPAAILRLAGRTLDFREPVGLVLTAVLGLIPDLDEACSIVHALMAALPSGSYLIAGDGTADPSDEQALKIQTLSASYGYRYRTRDGFARFFDGLDILDPGIVAPLSWRNGQEPDEPLAPIESCGVGRKP
ncbi:S-adenosyl methyltransferase [Parafrankia irregularis]|uniref:S-adenosyl methyltransferase n=1 Tax=Parafrankia irregularis TaxID=795642 RepID=A0A0S4R098_9ACTN|nr:MULTISPECIES: SAM-dependent methyltransferase [Parafrankia]MBE3206605.1 SAM-dependent methyltransferase [Parafrankia sp. CH37]MBE3206727.1 SAM-dependent methyltransferase [Parafrankia sp. CH37]CUU61253.1 S-adenosyl methyltransferase [Parafrankia irregularis]